MKKIYLSCLVVISIVSTGLSQDTLATDTTWRLGGYGSLQFSQVAMDNWAAGGENSISLTVIGFGFADYKLDKNYWNNYVLLTYGAYRGQYDETVRKNVDLIDIGTRAGHEIAKHWYLAGLVNFRSQFANGYNYPVVDTVVSKFLAPGYLLVSAGIEWKPVDYFSLFLSPATGKFTFVSDEAIADRGTYGNDPAIYDSSGVLISHGKKIRSEFGALFVAAFQKDIAKNVNLATKLTLFDNYTDKDKSNRDNVDVNFDAILNLKINEWLSASVYGSLIYDHNIFIMDLDKETGLPTGTGGPRTQWKEGLGVGITYKFGEEERH
jgi:hypothetical protein